MTLLAIPEGVTVTDYACTALARSLTEPASLVEFVKQALTGSNHYLRAGGREGGDPPRSALKCLYKLPTISEERSLARGGARGKVLGLWYDVEIGNREGVRLTYLNSNFVTRHCSTLSTCVNLTAGVTV